MEKDFTLKMKEQLLALKSELLDRLDEKTSEFNRLMESTGSKDEVDVATDASDSMLLETLSIQNMNRIKAIDNALARIELGKYGLCLKCGQPISPQRLEALPFAAMCIDCQSSTERRH